MKGQELGLGRCGDCRAAVTRAYQALRAEGLDEESALRVALKLLSLRHPGRSRDDVGSVVSQWLFEEAMP